MADTAQEVAASEHVPGRELAKTVIAKAGDGRLVMLALPATRTVHLGKLAAALGTEREREFGATVPDCAVGAMPPFGNLYDMQVYVDRTLAADERIDFQAGTHTEVAYADIARLVGPTVVDIA